MVYFALEHLDRPGDRQRLRRDGLEYNEKLAAARGAGGAGLAGRRSMPTDGPESRRRQLDVTRSATLNRDGRAARRRRGRAPTFDASDPAGTTSRSTWTTVGRRAATPRLVELPLPGPVGPASSSRPATGGRYRSPIESLMLSGP